jgi:hypothetical protein
MVGQQYRSHVYYRHLLARTRCNKVTRDLPEDLANCRRVYTRTLCYATMTITAMLTNLPPPPLGITTSFPLTKHIAAKRPPNEIYGLHYTGKRQQAVEGLLTRP